MNDDLDKKFKEMEASVEASMQEEQAREDKSVRLTNVDKDKLAVANELQMLIGLTLLLSGVLIIFNHVKVGSGFLALFGFGQAGFGLIIIPLLIGLGIIFFNWRLKLGWVITAASCALIFFAVLSQLIMTFPTTSLLGLILMFLPLAAGLALIGKSVSANKS